MPSTSQPEAGAPGTQWHVSSACIHDGCMHECMHAYIHTQTYIHTYIHAMLLTPSRRFCSITEPKRLLQHGAASKVTLAQSRTPSRRFCSITEPKRLLHHRAVSCTHTHIHTYIHAYIHAYLRTIFMYAYDFALSHSLRGCSIAEPDSITEFALCRIIKQVISQTPNTLACGQIF